MKQWKSYSEFQILSWTPAHLSYFDVYISDVIKITLSACKLGNI